MQQHKNISKLLSLILRHQPQEIGLQLNEHGWANIDELLAKLQQVKGVCVSISLLEEIVAQNDKQRFIFNDTKTQIRANQGHSIDIELNLPASIPPDMLYHGTAIQFIDSILINGLQKQSRQHVHLSTNIATAKQVGSRHGKPVILTINSKAMHQAGFVFYLSENNVWLTNHVPIQYILQ